LQLNHAAVLNVIPKGIENLKRKKIMGKKKSVIKKNRPKAVEKIQKKLKSYKFNHKVNQKKETFMI